MTSTVIMGFVIVGSLGLLTTGLKSFRRTTTDANLNSTNAQAVRKICENLKSAISISVSNGGKRIDYVLPKVSTVKDASTGEYEFMVPVQSDGVARSYVVDLTAGTVTDTASNQVILDHLAKTDPDKDSTQYGKAYTPFIVTTAGSVHAVTVNLVAIERLVNEDRYTRYKTTVIAHNIP
jgi:hypothetical protein